MLAAHSAPLNYEILNAHARVNPWRRAKRHACGTDCPSSSTAEVHIIRKHHHTLGQSGERVVKLMDSVLAVAPLCSRETRSRMCRSSGVRLRHHYHTDESAPRCISAKQRAVVRRETETMRMCLYIRAVPAEWSRP